MDYLFSTKKDQCNVYSGIRSLFCDISKQVKSHPSSVSSYLQRERCIIERKFWQFLQPFSDWGIQNTL